MFQDTLKTQMKVEGDHPVLVHQKGQKEEGKVVRNQMIAKKMFPVDKGAI